MTNLANKEYIQTSVPVSKDDHVIYGIFDTSGDFRPSKKESYLRKAAIEGFFYGVKLFFFALLGLITTVVFFGHTSLTATDFPIFFCWLFWLSASCAWYCFHHLYRRVFRFTIHKFIANSPDRR